MNTRLIDEIDKFSRKIEFILINMLSGISTLSNTIGCDLFI